MTLVISIKTKTHYLLLIKCNHFDQINSNKLGSKINFVPAQFRSILQLSNKQIN